MLEFFLILAFFVQEQNHRNDGSGNRRQSGEDGHEYA